MSDAESHLGTAIAEPGYLVTGYGVIGGGVAQLATCFGADPAQRHGAVCASPRGSGITTALLGRRSSGVGACAAYPWAHRV